MNSIPRSLLFAALVIASLLSGPLFAQSKPRFDSKVVTAATKGHAVAVDLDVSGAKTLYLVVTDGGDGFSCDWADWAEPRFVGKKGETKLTDLKWDSAAAGWGKARMNRNAGGGSLRINGQSVKYGIGTHAPSLIVFRIPPGTTRFKARAGLDNGGTDQNGGQTSSVRFLVYTQRPPRRILRASRGSSGGNASHDAKDAVRQLDTPPDLKATLFASEPMLKSPSNIDVDHRGRVWVCEIVNYRHFRNRNNPVRKEGDRILILEDTNGDGVADKSTVFYQGRDIDSAHGILVLGTPTGKNTKVIVSAGDKVQVFTDKDGDGKADSKETLFSGLSGVQHDHGIHAFVFGLDGKLYFNFGNEGHQVRDKHGKPIVDKAGNVVNNSRRPYQDGMVFRCNLDGSEFETLAWNFRNNWEVTVDSFGTLWQSDNDDDGNRGVRINYVMEFGNYGYKDELTGAGWRTPRTGMHAEIPKRHWHLNDPGVVPNLLQTGAGSPTGICVYEGTLLPKRFHNQILHCDAGPNVVRSYAVKNDGAGYSATINNILTGDRDKWFRPSDVCVAPDGSLFVADWYDPGVGGHAQGDVDRGRIFRVAPLKTAYKVPKADFRTTAGLIAALQSPNRATRYVAWQAIHQLGAQAEEPLKAVFTGSKNPRFRARALWLLGKIEVCGQHYVEAAITDKDPNIRITALRLARQIKSDLVPLIKQVVKDPSPQVRRECAITLHDVEGTDVPALWTQLALQHDGKDRWYLEALGIAARNREDACFAAWLKAVGGHWNTPAGRDIVWRSRSSQAMPLLAKIILDPRTDSAARLRYFRAFDFHQPADAAGKESKRQALLAVATGNHKDQADITSLAMRHIGNVNLSKSPKLKAAVTKAVEAAKGTAAYVRLVSRMDLSDRYPDLLAIAQKHRDEQLGVEAIRALLAKRQFPLIRAGLRNRDEKLATATATVLGNAGEGRIGGLLRPVIHDRKAPVAVRREAVIAFAKTRNGAKELLSLAQEKKLDSSLTPAVASALHTVTWRDIKAQAVKLFPLPPSKNNKPLPPIAELLRRRGNAGNGRVVFNTTGTCAKCHRVNSFGKDVGPDLSEIGKKLSRTAMWQSILFPSAAISHNYESYIIALESGNTVTGLITSRTKDSITLKGSDAIERTYKTSEIELIKKQDISLMPADIQKLMTEQELVDVVEYMLTLKKALKLPTLNRNGTRK
jgi:putative membrane-bound dehydrogenase-like protein